MKISFNFLFLFLLPIISFSQNGTTSNDYVLLKEQLIPLDTNFHFTIRPYTVNDFVNLKQFKNIKHNSKIISNLLNEDLLKIKKENYTIGLNPILHSKHYYYSENKSFFSDNRLGLSVFSKFKEKLFFTSNFFYANKTLPINDVYNNTENVIIPHFGMYANKGNGFYQFLSFTGELTYQPIKNIFFHIGRGKHFFGNGYRSLFLSENSNAYSYIKSTVDIWKIKYVWMATKLNDFELENSEALPFNLYKKAAFIHYFSLNITNRININFFETIITNPYDHFGNKTGYETAYFNPVIFFRPVEFYSGTSDNSMLGLGANVRLFKSLHLYSQFILDDLLISTLNDGSGWWGNKFGIQAGLKAYNLLNVEGLFFRGEINIVRPYTYSHGQYESSISNLNYGHYHQNLAHPMGANFAEGISEINYNKGRYMLSVKIILAKKGIDKDTVSYGGNTYKSYELRPSNNGISFLQGEISDFAFADFNISYLINPKYNLKFKVGAYHKKTTSNIRNAQNTVFYFGLSTYLFNEDIGF